VAATTDGKSQGYWFESSRRSFHQRKPWVVGPVAQDHPTLTGGNTVASLLFMIAMSPIQSRSGFCADGSAAEVTVLGHRDLRVAQLIGDLPCGQAGAVQFGSRGLPEHVAGDPRELGRTASLTQLPPDQCPHRSSLANSCAAGPSSLIRESCLRRSIPVHRAGNRSQARVQLDPPSRLIMAVTAHSSAWWNEPRPIACYKSRTCAYDRVGPGARGLGQATLSAGPGTGSVATSAMLLEGQPPLVG
jgi:hypothetical protein